MSKRAKILIAIITIVIIISALYVAKNRADNTLSQEPIKLGFVLPLTGNLAFVGEGARNAAKLALSTVGDTKHSYQLVFEDDAFNPKNTVTAVHKLIDIDGVTSIGTIFSNAGNVTSPITEQSKVIHFGIASDPAIAIGDYNYIHWTPPYEEVRLLISELSSHNVKNIAVLGAQIQGVVAVENELQKQIEGTDITIVHEENFNFGTTDFKTVLQKTNEKNPDMYVLFAFSPELEILTKQMRALGITTPITGIESFEYSNEPELFNNLWYINAGDPTSEFSKKYKDTYRAEAPVAAANVYDIVKLMVYATEHANSSNPTTSDIQKELDRVQNFPGALGNLSIDSDGFVFSKAVVRVMKDGVPMTISK